MDGKGCWPDNLFAERRWKGVKYEEVYLKEYSSTQELRKNLKTSFEFFNVERPHQSLIGQTPAAVCQAQNPRQDLAAQKELGSILKS